MTGSLNIGVPNELMSLKSSFGGSVPLIQAEVNEQMRGNSQEPGNPVIQI